MDLHTLSGTHLAALIREKRVTSRQVVEAHIEQVQRVNPVINAVVANRFEAARHEAGEADRVLAETTDVTSLPCFHGVPCTVKEAFALTGMPNASGLVARRDVRADHDATAVKRLRATGAIPLGVTNTSELCMWMETNNCLYGRTSNPYDPGRIAGGSSGGEAAIIASGASPFGVGSDIGGSIRGPAFFNGVFGHKPTGGLVPGSGQFPTGGAGAARILTTGPIARRAEDLWPLLTAMAGPDGMDTGCEARTLGDPSQVRIEQLTVIDVPENGEVHVHQDLRRAQERAVDALSRRGARVRTVRFEKLRHSFEIWSAMLAGAGNPPFGTMLGQGTPINTPRELARWTVGRSEHTLMALLLALGDHAPGLFPARARKRVEMGLALRAELVDAIGPNGVMLYPTYSQTAPAHDQPVRQALRLSFPFAYQGIMNVMELPSTQVPLGLDARGLPLGCQVVGIHGNDHVTIAVAMELERALGGWVPPPRWF